MFLEVEELKAIILTCSTCLIIDDEEDGNKRDTILHDLLRIDNSVSIVSSILLHE